MTGGALGRRRGSRSASLCEDLPESALRRREEALTLLFGHQIAIATQKAGAFFSRRDDPGRRRETQAGSISERENAIDDFNILCPRRGGNDQPVSLAREGLLRNVGDRVLGADEQVRSDDL